MKLHKQVEISSPNDDKNSLQNKIRTEWITNRNRGYKASYLLRNYRAKEKKKKKTTWVYVYRKKLKYITNAEKMKRKVTIIFVVFITKKF